MITNPPWVMVKRGNPVSDLPIGSTIKIKESGVLTDFLVVHQGLPSDLYDESCNGTWLLRKDIHSQRSWAANNFNVYESSDIYTWLNADYMKIFDMNTQNAIRTVKIPYRSGGGSSGADRSGSNGLSCKIFLLSAYEVGWTASENPYFPVDGAKLSYFDPGSGTAAKSKRIANYNDSADYWWLRSPDRSCRDNAWRVNVNGGGNNYVCSYLHGIRPALILPSDVRVDDSGALVA